MKQRTKVALATGSFGGSEMVSKTPRLPAAKATAARPMKPSGIPWLGDVPEGWEIDKIKYWFKATNTRGNTILQLLSATQKYGMYPQSKLEGIVQVAEKTDLNTFKTVHIDDFVISLRSFQGGIERSDYEGVCSPAYQTFHAMREINTGYFKYLFKSHGFIEAINRLTVGIREGKTINYSDVREMGVPFPPLPEQRAIAERIDCEVARVDALREKIKREIERLGDYKKSLIAETVAGRIASATGSFGGLEIDSKYSQTPRLPAAKATAARPMKPSGIPWLGDVPEGWGIDKVKYWFKATNTRGNTTLQLLSATQKYGMYPQSKLEGIVQVAEKTDLNTFKTVHVDDFVISLRSFQGGIERSDFEGVCSPAYQTFHAIREINTGYFKYLFKSHGFIEAINRLTVGIREGKTINYSDVREMNIPLPPIPEQREIAAYLDRAVSRIDAVVARRKAQLEKLESFKRSLIQEYVTGKREAK